MQRCIQIRTAEVCFFLFVFTRVYLCLFAPNVFDFGNGTVSQKWISRFRSAEATHLRRRLKSANLSANRLEVPL